MSQSPQLENGYTRISNELLEAIMQAGLTGRQVLVLMAIIRKTYGHQKKEDDMSASQIGNLCSMSRENVTRVLGQLESMKIITKRRGSYGNIIAMQKDYSQWKMCQIDTSVKLTLVSNRTDDSVNLTQVDSVKLTHTKENLPKETKQKKDIALSRNEHPLFERFYSAYPRKKSRGQASKTFSKINPSEQLVSDMIAGIERAMTSGHWNDIDFIRYPSTWLNDEGWKDEFQTEYTEPERAVIQSFNDALGECFGFVDEKTFIESRAFSIKAFLKFSDKPDFWDIYFSWVAENANLPSFVGFDWLISREGFSKVKGGQFTKVREA